MRSQFISFLIIVSSQTHLLSEYIKSHKHVAIWRQFVLISETDAVT
jgi:hypothetical protein